MRALITGSQGFVGRYLIREMQTHKWDLSAFDLLPPAADVLNYFRGDIQDKFAVKNAVRQSVPDVCIHLSGMAFVPDSWSNAEKLFSVNVIGTLNLLEAFRQYAPGAKILVISSAEVYGEHFPGRFVREQDALAPANHYAVSKAAADQTALLYARQYGMRVMTARPSNHIGPGQSPQFAVASFAEQLASMATGGSSRPIKVGNLENTRNFTDVRDVVKAYRLLIEKGKPGEAYNIASVREVTLRFILETLCNLAGVRPKVEIDQKRFRPDEPRPILDTTKITADTGWKPGIDLETTLRDIMAEVRFRVQDSM